MLTNFIIVSGYVGIFIAIFAESGFLLGFFLPGDSLLFTAGLFASQGRFSITILIGITMVAAIVGDNFGYAIGRRYGRRLFRKSDSLLFKKEYVHRTEEFFKEHGKKSIILARFVPIVRTFTPVMAGVGDMSYPVFLAFNVIGGVVWSGGLLGISYWLGSKFPGLDKYLSYIIIGIVLLSVAPIVIDYLRRRNKNKSNHGQSAL